MFTLRSSFVSALGGYLLLSSLAAPLLSAATFALCIHEAPAQIAARNDPATGPAYWRAFAAYGDQLKAAGILRGGAAFATPTAPARTGAPGATAAMARIAATTPAPANASAPALAPVAATEPVMGGFFLIEVASEAEALAWAARAPTPGGFVEVQTVLPMMAP